MTSYDRYESLRITRTDRILTVTLDPGLPRNALSRDFHTELSTVFADIRSDRDTDAVVITGAGKAFCAGADLAWLDGIDPVERDNLFVEGRRIIVDLLEVPQPIVAAIEGPAVGFGATLALFCDVKFAAETARIGDPHVLVGLVAGDGGAVIWPWLVGAGRAKRYLMTGDLVDGVRAEQLGLVDEVTPKGEALAAATAFAERLADGHQAAIRGTKTSVNKLLREAANLVLDTSLTLEKECMCSDAFPRAVAQMIERSAGP